MMRGQTADQFDNEPAQNFTTTSLTLSTRLSYYIGCTDKQFRHMTTRCHHPLLPFLDLHVHRCDVLYDGAALLFICAPTESCYMVQILWRAPQMVGSWPLPIYEHTHETTTSPISHIAIPSSTSIASSAAVLTSTIEEMDIGEYRQWCGTLIWYNNALSTRLYDLIIFNEQFMYDRTLLIDMPIIIRRLSDGRDIVLAFDPSIDAALSSGNPLISMQRKPTIGVQDLWRRGRSGQDRQLMVNHVGDQLIVVDRDHYLMYSTADIVTTSMSLEYKFANILHLPKAYPQQLYGRVVTNRVITLHSWPSKFTLASLNGANHFLRTDNHINVEDRSTHLCSFNNGEVIHSWSHTWMRPIPSLPPSPPLRSSLLSLSSTMLSGCLPRYRNHTDSSYFVLEKENDDGTPTISLYSLVHAPSHIPTSVKTTAHTEAPTTPKMTAVTSSVTSSTSSMTIVCHETMGANGRVWMWIDHQMGGFFHPREGGITIYRIRVPMLSESLTRVSGGSDMEMDVKNENKKYGFEKLFDLPCNNKPLWHFTIIPSRYNYDASDAIIEWVTCSLMDVSVGWTLIDLISLVISYLIW
jgi:hypothetical protein